MPYGIIKVDQVTFTNAGVDQTISVSGIVASISGNITATGTISGDVIRGGTLVSGATVTGTAGQFGTITGNTAGFTTVTGTTITGTTLTVASGTFTGNSTAAAFIPTGSTVPTNGVYLPSANNVAISTNGTGRLFVDASGNVGIGLASAGSTFRSAGITGASIIEAYGADAGGNADVEIKSNGSSGASRLFFSDTAAQSGSIVYSHTNNSFTVSTNAAPALTIDSSGKVGVGTSAPGSRLDVSEASPTNGVLARFINTTSAGGTNAGISLVNNDPVCSVDLIADRVAANFGSDFVIRLADGIDGTKRERLRITETGLVGIGTSNPGSVFHARLPNTSTATIATFDRSDGAVASEIHYDGSDGRITFGTTTNHPLSFETNNTRAVTIDSSQRVGIGTTSPDANLDVVRGSSGTVATFGIEGLTTNPRLRIDVDESNNTVSFNPNYSGATSPSIVFKTAEIERCRLDSSGRLLVGTSTARSNTFNGSVSQIFQIEGTTDTGRGAAIFSSSSTAGAPGYLVLGHQKSGSIGGNTALTDGDELGLISFQGSDGTEFVDGARIFAAVDGTSGANDLPTRLVFSTTADGASSPTEQLRITSNRYVRLASGTGGIQFNGDTAAANALDDYEEGTWTPAFTGTTTNPTVTYTYQNGYYTKIGNLVYIYLILTTSSVSGGSGTLTISGLPYPADTTGFYQIHRLAIGEAQSMTTPITSANTNEEINTTSIVTDVTTAALANGSNSNRVRINGWYVTS